MKFFNVGGNGPSKPKPDDKTGKKMKRKRK